LSQCASPVRLGVARADSEPTLTISNCPFLTNKREEGAKKRVKIMVMGREEWEGMAVSLRKKLGLREEWCG